MSGAGLGAEATFRAAGTLGAIEPASRSWMASFEGFTVQHLLTAGVCVLVMAAWAWAGRRLRGTAGEERLRWFAAGAGLMGQVLLTIYWAEPARRSAEQSWPFHLCDLAAFVAPAALMLPRVRWLTALVFYWGIGLSSQAFIQPTLKEGMASGVFWFYWFQHVFIVGAGIYAAAAMGYRPTWRDLGFVTLVDVGLLAAITPVNMALGANYMYVGDAVPEGAPLLGALGEWPLRAVWVFVIAHAVLLVLTAVWRVFTPGVEQRGAH